MRLKYVRCSSCNELKPTDKQCYIKRLEKYGSIDKMEEKWVCNNCKKGIKPLNSDIITLK